MNRFLSVESLMAGLTLAGSLTMLPVAEATVGYPNIVLHNKADGANKVWQISGGTFLSETAIQPTVGDHSWKIVGTGDFTGDGQVDLFWQHPTGLNAVWEMNGLTYVRSHSVEAMDPNWKIVL